MSASERNVGIQVRDTPWLRLAQVGWLVTAAVAAGILIASIPGYLFFPSLGVFDDHLVREAGTTADLLIRVTNVASLLSATGSLSLAVFLFLKKRADPMGLFLAYYLLGHGILFAGPIELLQPYWEAAPWVNSFILLPLFFGPMTMALITLFPDGRFVPSWSRWLIPISLLAVPVSFLSGGDTLPVEVSLTSPFGTILIVLSIVSASAAFVIAIYIQLHRYRKVSTPEQRLQTKWVLYGIGLWFAVNVVTSVGWTIGLQLPANTPVPAWLPLASLFWVSSSLLLPAALTISITRYRLFDIDLIINRTLVYGGLSLGIVATYVLVVGALGALFQSQGSILFALLATGLIAVLFQPLRDRLQQRVNRLMFGERDNPYAILSKLSAQLQTTATPEATLQSVVETVSETLKLPYVAIELADEQGPLGGAVTGKPLGDKLELPLRYQNEAVGRLVVSPRSPGETFNQHEQRLLADIAAQTGPMAHAVRLTAALQRSRERLVLTREEERRRIRRDLHDELGPTLASQTFAFDTILDLLETKPQEAARLLRGLKSQNQETVAEIRRLVNELRPPALDELGLLGALQAHVAKLNGRTTLPIKITATPNPLPPLSAAVEVAAYRIALEAITNVVRHAQASQCYVLLKVVENGRPHLQISITDNGTGLPDKIDHGLGLRSMRERAEELGASLTITYQQKGTQVTAVLPISISRETT